MSRVILAVALFAAIVAVSATDSSAHHLFLRARHSKGAAQFAASSGPVRIPVEKGHGWHEAPTPSRHSHIVGDKAQYFVHYSAFDKNEPLSDPAAILQTIADVISCDKSRVQYVPEHTFVAMMTAEQAEQVQQLPFVLWVGKVKPEHKFDDHVFSDPHAKAKAELRATSVARPFTLRTAPGASVALPHIPLLGIHRIEVLLHPGAVSSREEAVVLAQSWAAHFKPAASAGVAIQSVESDELALAAYAVSPNIMHWAVSEAHLSDVVEFMSHQEQVQFVYAVEPAHTFNYDSASIIQTNKLPTDSGSTRIWSKGLTGQGQVIGVGDSGLDYRNCLFYDPSVDLDSKICSQCNLFSYYTQDLQNLYTNPACIQTDAKCINATGHRKVKGYYAFVDNLDPLWGHGSHVCGTVAGKARSGSPALLTQYNGNAPDAQLVISDLNSDTILNEADIATPPDLSADYFQYSYKLGARVHTNSWGSKSNVVYGSASQLIDRFTYQYKDMLVLFAAGNGGTGGFQTVASQAQAKNILTVGSSNTDVSHRAAVFDAQVSEAWQRINRTVCTASVWNAPYKSGVDMTVCGAVKFYYSTTDSCDTLSAYFCNAIQDPTYCVTLEAGKNSAGTREYGLANALPHVQGIGTEFASCSLNAIAVVDPIGNQETNITGIAYYSSRGPTSDGRIKPDLVAPGNYIISSRAAYPKLASGEFCSDDNSNPLYALAAKSGTSMATPGLAGAAALVRQYYADGYGACGQADSAHSPTYISSALLKATLIHSGVLIAGPYINSTDPQLSHFLGTDPRDRFVRGFGLAKLSSVLRFTDDQYELLYYDVNAVSFSDRRVATGVSKDFPFTLSSSSGPLKVTLVWSDPPPSGVSGVTLVNNLDLIVTDPSNNVYYGNHFFVSNSRDTLNNVEQVRLDNVVAGTWTITVNGFNVPIDSPSDYALIVTYKTSSPASQYPLCSSTPSPLPGPVFTTAPTVSDADVKSGRHVIVGSLSVPGKVYYAAIKRGSASPPLSPYQLSHFLFGNGNDMDSSVVKGFVSTAGSNSFTVEVVLPAGRWTVYLVAADASDVTQAQMTALDAFASSGPRTAAGWLLTVSLIVLGTMFAVLF